MRVIIAVLVLSALAVVLAGDSIDDNNKWVEWLKSYDSGTPVLVSRTGDENKSNGTPVPDHVYLHIVKEVLKKLSKKKDNNEDAADDDEVARYILKEAGAEEPPEITNSIAPIKDSDTISSPGMIGRDI